MVMSVFPVIIVTTNIVCDSSFRWILNIITSAFQRLCSISGKAFEITYVRLKFFSSRPESFAIYKRRSEDSEWTPFQFYSASCEETYNLTSRPVITSENEGKAVCRDDFSDISPLTGGSVAFSTLEGRPRAYEFEKSQVLQVFLYYLSLVFLF